MHNWFSSHTSSNVNKRSALLLFHVHASQYNVQITHGYTWYIVLWLTDTDLFWVEKRRWFISQIFFLAEKKDFSFQFHHIACHFHIRWTRAVWNCNRRLRALHQRMLMFGKWQRIQGSHTSGAKKFQTFSRLFPNSNKKFPYHSPTVLRSTIPCPCYCFITVIHVYMYLRQINGLVFLATCLYVKWVGRCKIKGHNFQSMRGWYNHFNCSDGRSAVFFT